MPTPLLGLLLALLCLLQGSAPPPLPPVVQGHLVLVIEGNAAALRVTAAAPKPDPWGGVPRGLESRHSIAILAADGSVLGSYPLDLSHFDLDPANIGTGPRVEGCQVVDTQVTALASVPRFRDAVGLVILHDGRAIGTVTPPDYSDLLRAEQKR